MTGQEVARELARIDLPLSTYTQWYWKIDLHNLLHFLTLRVDTHAQWEIQEFGRVMAGMLKRVAPLSYEAWIDYDVCGTHLSRAELESLRALVKVEGTASPPYRPSGSGGAGRAGTLEARNRGAARQAGAPAASPRLHLDLSAPAAPSTSPSASPRPFRAAKSRWSSRAATDADNRAVGAASPDEDGVTC